MSENVQIELPSGNVVEIDKSDPNQVRRVRDLIRRQKEKAARPEPRNILADLGTDTARAFGDMGRNVINAFGSAGEAETNLQRANAGQDPVDLPTPVTLSPEQIAEREKFAAESPVAGAGGYIAAGLAGGPTMLATGVVPGAIVGGLTHALASPPGATAGDAFKRFAAGAATEAFGGGAVWVLSRLVAKMAHKYLGKAITPFAASGEFSDEAIDLFRIADETPETLGNHWRKELRALGWDPRVAEKVNLYPRHGITPPTRAQIAPTPGNVAAEAALAREAPEAVIGRKAQQHVDIRLASERMITNLGGRAQSVEEASQIGWDAVNRRMRAADDEVSRQYEAVRASLGSEKNVSLEQLTQFMRENVGADKSTGDFVNGLLARLQTAGVLPKGMKKGKALNVRPARIDVETAEMLRQQINEFARKNPDRWFLAGEAKDVLDTAVARASGSDPFKAARVAKRQLEQSIEGVNTAARPARREGLLARAVSGRVQGADLVDDIFKSRTSPADIKQYLSFLRSGSPDDVALGQEAIAELRGGVIRRAFAKAFTNEKVPSGDLTPTYVFDGKAFRDLLETRLGREKRIALFDPETNVIIEEIAEIGEMIMPPGWSGEAGETVFEEMADDVSKGLYSQMRRLWRSLSQKRRLDKALNPMGRAGDVVGQPRIRNRAASAVSDVRRNREPNNN